MTSTTQTELHTGSLDGDAVTEWLAEMLVTLGGFAAGAPGADDAARIDRIGLLEKIQAAASAAQSAEIVAFGRTQVAAAQQQADRVDYRRLRQGIADQVALATRTSGWHGSRRLNLARDLVTELPRVFALLADGRISDYVTRLVATETSHLDADTRRAVDQQLVDQRLEDLGPQQAAGLARKLTYAADPEGATRRAKNARSDRHVSLRPAPDTMCWLSALLPVEDGVRALAALTRHADTLKAAGDERRRGQIMADAVTARLTGQEVADQRPVELNLTIPLEHLTNPDDETPAEIPGFGPVPAGIADEIVGKAGAQLQWRRLFTAPAFDGLGRVVVGGDPKLRRFGGWLAKLLKLRDGVCRVPWCEAPIRHSDHIVPRADGGPTTFPNGQGLCERHNYTHQQPGWLVEVIAWSRGGAPELIATTTPTGHTYLSRAPNPP